MGSFAGTCTISGLPIEAEEPVRLLLLVENPFFKTESRPSSSFDVWCPRTYPLRGVYSGYGYAKDIEEGPARDVWLEALSHDTVPRGWGANTVHDVAVKKKMSWDQALDAVYERRLRVRARVEDISHVDLDAALKRLRVKVDPKTRTPVPPGIPTRARLEKIIVRAGLRLYGDDENDTRGGGEGGYLITKTAKGEVRIRYQHWGDDGPDTAHLEKLLPLLSEYATMISAGPSQHSVLIVRPKPNTPNFHGGVRTAAKSVEVSYAMIREDIWQALIHFRWKDDEDEDEESKLSLSAYYRAVDEYIAATQKQIADRQKLFDLAKTSKDKSQVEKHIAIDQGIVELGRRFGGSRLIDRIIGRDPLPFVLGPPTHAYLLRKKGLYPREFLRTAAEFAYVNSILSATRFHWRPTFSIGPQFGYWPMHAKLLSTFTNVARAVVNKLPPE